MCMAGSLEPARSELADLPPPISHFQQVQLQQRCLVPCSSPQGPTAAQPPPIQQSRKPPAARTWCQFFTGLGTFLPRTCSRGQ